MAYVNEKIRKNRKYFYLSRSYREDGKPAKHEKYIGTEVPKNINELRQEFEHKIFMERYKEKLSILQKNFRKEQAKLPKSAKEKYMDSFMIKYTYNTNRIEGSTVTLKETADLLELGISPRKPIRDVKETESHRDVFFKMVDFKDDLNLKEILNWHHLLFKHTDLEIAGNIRKHSVAIARSKVEFPMAAELDLLLKDFLKWYNNNKKIFNPLELAALVHLKFVSIHPLSDGNGRISRLLMNYVLNYFKYPMLNIKYSNRNSYYNALERSQLKEDDYIFVNYVIRKYLEEYKDYLN